MHDTKDDSPLDHFSSPLSDRDVRLLHRMFKSGWHCPAAMRQELAMRLLGVLSDDSRRDRIHLSAASSLLLAERLD